MGIICGGEGGHVPPTFYSEGNNISIAHILSSKFYITDAENEAINNIMKYTLNTNKYKIIKGFNKICFTTPPLSLFYRQYGFPMYFLITRLFSSMPFLSEMHSLGDIGWVRLG